jgi:hypothetical protein
MDGTLNCGQTSTSYSFPNFVNYSPNMLYYVALNYVYVYNEGVIVIYW